MVYTCEQNQGLPLFLQHVCSAPAKQQPGKLLWVLLDPLQYLDLWVVAVARNAFHQLHLVRKL